MTTLPKVIHELCADEPAVTDRYDLHRFVHNCYFLGCLVAFSQDFPFACPNLAQRRLEPDVVRRVFQRQRLARQPTKSSQRTFQA